MNAPDAADCSFVIFDYDGTLVDSQHGIFQAMSLAFARAEAPPPTAAAVRRVVGLSLEEAIERLLDGHGSSAAPGLVDRVAGHYREAFFEIRTRPDHSELLFPAVRETLARLDGPPRRLGIATGKARRGLFASLEHHGLKHHFSTFQTADLNPGKPNPQMVLRALDEVGAARAETLLVGDTVYDMEMAANAGVRAIGVAWGYHDPAELTAAGAAHILNDMAELIGLVATESEES